MPEETVETEISEKEAPDPAEEAGGLILSFDDFSFSWLEMIPLLEKYGVHATFYISVAKLEDDNLSVLKELQYSGHEIGWHTSTHPNMRKIPVSMRSEAIDREIRDPLLELKKSLHRDIVAFAYPYGLSDKDWESRLLDVFTSTRGFCRTPRYYSPDELNERQHFVAASLDNLYYRPDSGEEWMPFPLFCDRVLNEIEQSGRYVVLASHGMNDNAWGITRNNVEILLAKAQKEGISVLSLEEAFFRESHIAEEK